MTPWATNDIISLSNNDRGMNMNHLQRPSIEKSERNIEEFMIKISSGLVSKSECIKLVSENPKDLSHLSWMQMFCLENI